MEGMEGEGEGEFFILCYVPAYVGARHVFDNIDIVMIPRFCFVLFGIFFCT